MTHTLEAEHDGYFRLSEPLIVGAARRQLETDLDLLKTLLDARAEPENS
jgi:hypothetical protein